MEKLVYKITLISLSLLAFKLDANQDSQTNNAKDSIRYAIKKSKPDLLKKALVGIELTEKEKHWLSIFANEVIQIRRNKMNRNLIKPRPRKVAHEGYFFTTLGILGLSGCLICGCLSEEVIKKCPAEGLFSAIIIATGATLIIKRLMDIADKANKEYFKLHPYRSYKQKYLDSINVLELIQLN